MNFFAEEIFMRNWKLLGLVLLAGAVALPTVRAENANSRKWEELAGQLSDARDAKQRKAWLESLFRLSRPEAIKTIQSGKNAELYQRVWKKERAGFAALLQAKGDSLLPDREGFIDLFNRDLDGWNAPKDSWVWAGDVLECRRGGNLRSKVDFQDFILRFEVSMEEGSNNGISFRHSSGQGSEIQILDNNAPQHRNIKSYQFHGSLYAIQGAVQQKQKPLGEWNEMSVELRGENLWVRGNDGATLVKVNLPEAVKSVKEKHYDRGYEWAYQGALSPKGSITFLGHSGPVVRFRNIRIKDLGAGIPVKQ